MVPDTIWLRAALFLLIPALLIPAKSFAIEPDASYGFVFLGATSVNHFAAAAGVEYMRVGHGIIGYGLKVDRSLGALTTTYLAAPVSLNIPSTPHLTMNIRLFLAPGISIEKTKTEFAFEAGIGGIIPLGSAVDWTLIPHGPISPGMRRLLFSACRQEKNSNPSGCAFAAAGKIPQNY
jgi:hypothetical protein